MAVMVDGEVPEEVTPKDLILALISEIGTGGGPVSYTHLTLPTNREG